MDCIRIVWSENIDECLQNNLVRPDPLSNPLVELESRAHTDCTVATVLVSVYDVNAWPTDAGSNAVITMTRIIEVTATEAMILFKYERAWGRGVMASKVTLSHAYTAADLYQPRAHGQHRECLRVQHHCDRHCIPST